MRGILLGVLFFIPSATEAAVVISEVAWMGSTASANHEWIELQNTGAAVDVSGWTLTDGMNLSITLEGIIPAQSYVVLERTSDETVSGSAFLIYTGALVNTGAVLELKRADSGLEDQVAGGENWSFIGGDNITKETAQYTSGGWVTGTPTPGTANRVSNTPPVQEEDDTKKDDTTKSDTVTSAKKSSSGETVRLVLPPVSLKLAIDAQKIGYVNQPIPFTVEASGIGKNLISSLVYEWNFGDGNIASTKSPTHTFSYPGTYAVVAYASYGRQKQLHRHDITILPVDISVTKSERGDVQISNDSPYEIDVSEYTVFAGKTFTFPKFSLLLPNQTVTLPKKLVGDKAVSVRDATGSFVPTTVANVSSRTNESKPVEVIEKSSYIPKTSILSSSLEEDSSVEPIVAGIATSTEEAAPKEIIIGSSSRQKAVKEVEAWPYVALVGIVILGLFGVARKLRGNQNQ